MRFCQTIASVMFECGKTNAYKRRLPLSLLRANNFNKASRADPRHPNTRIYGTMHLSPLPRPMVGQSFPHSRAARAKEKKSGRLGDGVVPRLRCTCPRDVNGGARRHKHKPRDTRINVHNLTQKHARVRGLSRPS